jgi:guanine deaminase
VPSLKLYRGRIFNPLDEDNVAYYENGSLLVNQANGQILMLGDADEIVAQLNATQRAYESNFEHADEYIIPGLVDTHIHYPQARIIASAGADLLQWLETSTFPEEIKMRDPDHAQRIASFFLSAMLSAGTTSALVYGVTYLEAMDVLCREAETSRIRIHPGKMLMDIGAPEALLDPSPGEGYEQAQEFIERWRGRGNIQPSIALRFALTSSEEQMRLTARLLDENPDLLFQTHLNESKGEIDAVAARFPELGSYLGVYDHFGLHRSQGVYGHCVHMRDDELVAMRQVGSAATCCPCSNLYLGSGLFQWQRFEGIRVGFGSDVAGGYTYSIIENARLAHVLQKLEGNYVSPEKLLYYATLGGAIVLRDEERTGSLDVGKQADFVVLSPGEDQVAQAALDDATTSSETLRSLIMLHDRSHVRATFIDGQLAYSSSESPSA